MSHKVNPTAHRLGGLVNWKSRWFDVRAYRRNLKEDTIIREYLQKSLRGMGIADIEIERSAKTLSIYISTSRPGLIIGRGGSGIEDIRKKILVLLAEIRSEKNMGDAKDIPEIRLEVREIRTPELHAELVGQQVAEQLERRMPFRRTIKQALDRVMAQKEIQGARIMVKGRLDGTEMSRKEFVMAGQLPLQTLRADVDYAHVSSYTSYGVVGVKVWIYKGEKLES